VVETVGAWVVLTPPPPPLFPPPHPIIKAFDSRIAVSIVAAADIVRFAFLKRVKELTALALFNYRQIRESNLRATGDKDLKSYYSFG